MMLLFFWGGVFSGFTTMCYMNEPGEDLDQPVHPRNLDSLRKARYPRIQGSSCGQRRLIVQTAQIVQSCMTEMLCLGLFIFFFAKVTLKLKEVGYGIFDRNMKHCKILHVRPLKIQISLCSLILGRLCSSTYFI